MGQNFDVEGIDGLSGQRREYWFNRVKEHVPDLPDKAFYENMELLFFRLVNEGLVTDLQQGPRGPQGLKGDHGADGPTGFKGDTGPRGIQGIQGIPGDQGLRGFTGERGLKGEIGSKGLQGPVGSKGETGAKGKDGTSVTIIGTVATADDLPTTGNKNGDGWITDDGNLHVWNGTSFTNVGTVRGPEGPIGLKGDRGDTGERGVQGLEGPIGPRGLTGDRGLKGDTGLAGTPGTKGDKGDPGLKGDTGSNGTPGVKGDKGDKGDRGGLPPITFDAIPLTGIVSAHRGGGATNISPVAPEGTIAGLRTAYNMGAHILDIDYRLTADSVMVSMHDATVDRTTVGSGLVSNHTYSTLPDVRGSEYVGQGWPNEPIPTIEEIFQEFGGKAILTIEAKDGVPSVAPLAALIKKYELENCVFINTKSIPVVEAIVAAGCAAHLWAHTDSSLITPGIDAGASLIELKFNAPASEVNQCLSAISNTGKALRWVIAGPISTREQVGQLTAGLMGHVTDALGMTNRSTGDVPLIKSIRPSLMAGKRGIGWKYFTDDAPETGVLDIIPGKGMKFRVDRATDTLNHRGVYLGDVSGTNPGTTFRVKMSFIPDESFIGDTTKSVRFRAASTIPDATAQDNDTTGYVVAVYGGGKVNLWTSSGAFGGGINIYSDSTAHTLVAGTEYTIELVMSPATIRVEALGKSSGSIANTDWRGSHHYVWTTKGGGNAFITDFIVST